MSEVSEEKEEMLRILKANIEQILSSIRLGYDTSPRVDLAATSSKTIGSTSSASSATKHDNKAQGGVSFVYITTVELSFNVYF